MSLKNADFNAVSIEQNSLESLIVFQINNVGKHVKRTSIGQFIQSSAFELIHASSIGRSKWVVILFLNGQYEKGGNANETIAAYLKMLSCEHESNVYKVDVTFQLGSEFAKVKMSNQSLCYDNVNTRWIGVKLLKTHEMIINGNRFIQNDTLMLSLYLREHLLHSKEANQPLSDENYYLSKSKASNKLSTERMPSDKSSNGQRSNQSFYDTNRNHVSKNSHNSACETQGRDLSLSRQPLSKDKHIRDSNFNHLDYAENEFSDSEEEEAKPNSAKVGWLPSLYGLILNLW